MVSFTPIKVNLFQRRQLLRAIWASEPFQGDKQIKYIFVVGHSKDNKTNEKLAKESKITAISYK
jgi:hypothetical protein